MAGIIDADTHVVESDYIWRMFDKDLYHRRPVAGRAHRSGDGPGPQPLDDRRRHRSQARRQGRPRAGDAAGRSGGAEQPPVAGEDAGGHGAPPRGRRPHGRRGAGHLPDAVHRPHHRRSGARRGAGARLQPVHGRCMAARQGPPALGRDPALHGHSRRASKELEWSRERGAVGFMARGLEGERSLAEPYFFPVYEEASRLDMPMCIHTGPGSPAVDDSHRQPHRRLLPCGPPPTPGGASRTWCASRVPERFPDLRIGFIETGAPGCRTCCTTWSATGGASASSTCRTSGRSSSATTASSSRASQTRTSRTWPTTSAIDNLISGSDYGHHFGQLPTLEPDSFANRR